MKFQSLNWCHSGSDGIWLIALMVRHHIPKEYQDIALHLSLNEGFPDLQIQAYIGISPCSMRCPQKTWRGKGKTTVKLVITGWPQLLNTLNALVHCILFTYKSIIIHICSFWKVWLSASLTCWSLNCRNIFMSFAMSMLHFWQLCAHCINEDTLWNVYVQIFLLCYNSKS
jgi:hypothetical protein